VHRDPGVTAVALSGLRDLDPGVPLEIVVAVDSRTSPEGLGDLAEVADRIIGFEFTGANRFRPWLREQARGDWLLLLDYDEQPSERLVQVVPELIDDRGVGGYAFPRLNPFPTPDTYPAGGSWDDDVQLRLVRNDGNLRFAGTKHTGAEYAGPIARRGEPIIHLHLLLDPAEERARKTEAYEGEQFGKLTLDGLPLNEVMYLPERQRTHLRAMDPAEAARARRAVAGRAAARPLDTALPTAGGPEVERWLDWLPIGEDDACGRLTVARAPGSVPAGARFDVEVEVTNLGAAVWARPWPGQTGHPPRVSYHWRSPDGASIEEDGLRTDLPTRILPGGTSRVEVQVLAPERLGPAHLVLDVVQDGVRWFGIDHTLPVLVEPGIVASALAGAKGTPSCIPLDRALAQRRRTRQIDGLQAAFGSAEPGRRHRLDVGGWALDVDTLDHLAQAMREQGLSRILEFGSGTSTVVLGALAAELGGRLLSIEQDPRYRDLTTAAIDVRGLSASVSVTLAPLVPTTTLGLRTIFYDVSEGIRDQIRALRPQLVLVDGPSQVSGASRLAAVPSLIDLVDPGTQFAMDDAFRDAELRIGELWQEHPDLRVDGVLALGAGLLVGSIGTRPKTQRWGQGLIGRARARQGRAGLMVDSAT
jgi:hypothetical protein